MPERAGRTDLTTPNALPVLTDGQRALVEKNAALAPYMVAKTCRTVRTEDERDDLLGVAFYALARGHAFSSYACASIRGLLLAAMAENAKANGAAVGGLIPLDAPGNRGRDGD